MLRSKLIIGWREWVQLPDFGGTVLKAKIDTGARTSAIHAYRIRTETGPDGPVARFQIHPRQKRRKPSVECCAPIVERRDVKSSNGHIEQRFVVATRLMIGPFMRTIELTLTNRDEMGFRMLIGREALSHQFIVDSGLSYALGDKGDLPL